jgi:uncharacterized membrane protein
VANNRNRNRNRARRSASNGLATRPRAALDGDGTAELVTPTSRIPVDGGQIEGLVASGAQIKITQHYSGPVPPAAELERYEQLLPGSADRMLKMAEQGLAHRMQTERRESLWEHLHIGMGQIFALLVFLVIMLVSYRLVMSDHGWVGGVFGTLDVVALVTVFVYPRSSGNGDGAKLKEM